jgi:4-amino-4-deoxy-L-arabinose transferase-like glycosyltransferase
VNLQRFFPLATVIALLPVLPSPVKYTSDEALYTNAAIAMARGGDWLTPTEADGSVRLRKPILTYWLVAAAYKVGGIGLVSSRLPFLLCAAALVGLTYRLALLIFQRRDVAALAAAILISNSSFTSRALQSTPDILLSFLMGVSFFGFAGLIFRSDARLKYLMLAYGGAALAAETKGLVALVPVALAWGCCLARSDRRECVRRLTHGPIMALALLVAVAWFGAMAWIHGPGALNEFIQDQVVRRVGLEGWNPLWNAWDMTTDGARQFLPWVILAAATLPGGWAGARRFWRQHRHACLFLFGAYVVLLLVFSLGHAHRSRYLLPAYPLLAVGVAALLVHWLEEPSGARRLSRAAAALLWAAMAGGALILVFGFLVHTRIFLGALLFEALAIRLYVWGREWPPAARLVSLGFVGLAGLALAEIAVRPVFTASPGPALARRLELEDVRGRVAAVGAERDLTAQLPVLSGGRVTVDALPRDAPPEQWAAYPAVIFRDGAPARAVECGFAFRRWTGADLRELVVRRGDPAFLERKKERYFLTMPARDNAGRAAPPPR